VKRSLLRDYVAHPDYGPLPALLLTLTVTTGIVDAVSILRLGRVFVANMTGNIVFIGFGMARAPGFSLAGSVVALLAFLTGAAVGGPIVQRLGAHRGILVRTMVAAEFGLLAIATVISALGDGTSKVGPRYTILVLAAVALGLQNTTVRKLAVPDLTTTVLTMTLTGIAADLRSGNGRVALRRLLSVLAMLAGAFVGALLVLHVDVYVALALAAALVGVVAATAAAAARTPAAWHDNPRRDDAGSTPGTLRNRPG
jgi:uncharacterized membrane protein YoaK (UPF0700 family)